MSFLSFAPAGPHVDPEAEAVYFRVKSELDLACDYAVDHTYSIGDPLRPR